jgi:AcrR family transcriptional regulator
MTDTLGALASFVPVCRASKLRDRIVTTARELFHRHGIRGVGVDAIAGAAGTNKMTLYRHFGSKDDLICACLRELAREKEQNWDELAALHAGDPLAHLRSWVRYGGECLEQDVRGCDFVNAAIELTEGDHPARRLIEEFKTTWRNRLVALCAAAGASQPELLADTLYLLFDGARVSRQAVGAEGPSARYVRMGEAVISAFLEGRH